MIFLFICNNLLRDKKKFSLLHGNKLLLTNNTEQINIIVCTWGNGVLHIKDELPLCSLYKSIYVISGKRLDNNFVKRIYQRLELDTEEIKRMNKDQPHMKYNLLN